MNNQIVNVEKIQIEAYRQNKKIDVEVPIVNVPEIEYKDKYPNDPTNYEYDEVITGHHTEYVMPCKAQFKTEFWNVDRLKHQHIVKCEACLILIGKSKATKVSNDTVVTLFNMGKTGFIGNSVKSEENCLYWNFGDLLAIRLLDGTIAYNSQVTSVRAGIVYKSAPRVHDANGKQTISIPLDTITSELLNNAHNPEKYIEILDYNDDSRDVLIRLTNPVSYNHIYALYGYDERAPFMAELPAIVKTIAEAKDTLVPMLARVAIKNSLDVKRQGDIFFVELDDSVLQTPIKAEDRKIKYTYESSHEESLPLDDNGDQTYDISNGVATDKVTVKHEVNRYERMPIYDTRHTATLRAKVTLGTTEYQTVKGTIRHEGKQHKAIKLAKWYIAIKNRALVSWNVDPRSRQRFD